MASSENYEFGSSSNLRISLLEKREVGVTKALDRISKLPDSLLVRILSVLPTQEAFTTSILSKRWRYVWPYVDSFNFTRKNYLKTKDFVSFVDYVLARSLSSKIKRLDIDCSYLHPYKSHVSRWLSIAVEKNVEDFVYRSSSNSNGCTLPQSFYYCSLVTLHLTFYCFDYGAVIKWKSLKNIKLEYVVLSDDDFVKLLSGCPALETMEVDMVGGFSRLEISSLKMKRLNLKGLLYFSIGNDHFLEIHAPYLHNFEISGFHQECSLVDVSLW
ncbi:LOW QUALITY PROTEIN: putative F-box/LRR-repeat protein At5g02930 [Solanum verrucosum]|uniref:LOW QUALITY PROTEIN: putative F-box/LRR-repeat protein At5g02930 n=1 Tax=Solanum verrucosum TaxID=315347 RepID=UPI0020D0B261|nr:LOW QUALITY PROTEIN: putative F-box/LRR-repeat protein At5g02930 [Solanum verrucosum]